MNIGVLRIRMPSDRFDALIPMLPAERVDSSWREGDRRTARLTHTTSGANVFLAEGDSPALVQQEALRVIEAMSAVLQQLASAGATMELDFGVSLAEDAWTQSVAFAARDLGLLERHGVELRLSLYRANDD